VAHCLVVDDDPTVAGLLVAVLSSAGHDVDVASCAEEAENRAATRRPDMVFVDRHLPDRAGAELVTSLIGSYPGLPVVMVSGAVGPAEEKEALAAGARELLGKPFDSIGHVLAAAERALSRGQA
jgi:DNA-binding response OmpR family regulator